MTPDSLIRKGATILNRFLLGVPKKVYWWHRHAKAALTDYEYKERELFFRRAFRALSFNGISGDYLEFGCCGGMTFSLAYRQSRKYGMHNHQWAFDSFCGLPPKEIPEDEHPVWDEGVFAMRVDDFRKTCIEKGIPLSEFTIVAGFYKQTLTGQSNIILPTEICLAYLDCDLYSSSVAVLEFLMTRLKHGMIIAFDDYYCWSSHAVSGERKACSDYFKNNNNWALVPFVQYGWHGMSFVVESRSLEGVSSISY